MEAAGIKRHFNVVQELNMKIQQTEFLGYIYIYIYI